MDRTISWKNLVKEYLPHGYEYALNWCKVDVTCFRVDIRSEKKLSNWLSHFKQNIQWVLQRSRPKTPHVFEADYRCPHGVPGKRPKVYENVKNTGCRASLSVKITQHLPNIASKPATCTLSYSHNHHTDNATAIRRNRVTAATTEKLKAMGQQGHTPGSAYANIRLQYSDEPRLLADRSIVPDYKYVHNLFRNEKTKRYGKTTNPVDMIANVEEMMKGMTNIKHQCTNTSNGSVVALITPLMARCHTLTESGNICFMDSTGGLDGTSIRMFLLVTHSPAGAVPLGVFFVTSEAIPVIKAGLDLINSLLGPAAFNGKGSSGPGVFITDDSAAERRALASVFPEARLLLCSFHILQAITRWCARLPSDDSEKCYKYVYNILYCHSVDGCQALLREKTVSDDFELYFRKHYEPRVKDWALCYRSNLSNDDINTNNHVERQFRTIKEELLGRKTAYNTVELAERISEGYERVVTLRVLDAAHDRRPLIGLLNMSTATAVRENLYWLGTGSAAPADWCGPLVDGAGAGSSQKRKSRELTQNRRQMRRIPVNKNRKRLRKT